MPDPAAWRSVYPFGRSAAGLPFEAGRPPCYGEVMPWSDLPDPVPPMTPRERVAAILGRLGCLGAAGLVTFALILAYVASDWLPAASAVAP